MRGLFSSFIFYLFLFALDIYAFQALRTIVADSAAKKWIYFAYWLIHFAFYVFMIYLFNQENISPFSGDSLFSIFLSSFLLLYIPKLFAVIPLILEDLSRLFIWLSSLVGTTDTKPNLSRRAFVSKTSIILGALPFIGVLHGIWKGRYKFRVIEKDLYFTDLPEAFDGFKITQISDIHIGSFSNKDPVKYGVDLIKSIDSDLVVFTGDLVNVDANEMNGWFDIFSDIPSKHGNFAVMGNHDYYASYWKNRRKENSPEIEDTKLSIKDVHQKIGFDLLLNENRSIEKDGEKLYIVGVENWGRGPFPKYADLDKALVDVPDDAFKIIMSHDPSHWEDILINHKTHFPLTLSGHTHGCQVGVELPFLKYSPIQYRYPRWAGLYEEKNQKIYINRGFGTLVFPGRVGMWPEITLLNLRKA